MASKLLIMYEEANFIKTEILKLQRQGGKSSAGKISDLRMRLKALNQRAESYGTRGNLFLVNFLDTNRYFADIAEEDIEYLVEHYAKQEGVNIRPEYSYKKIPLGKAIEY